MRVVENNMQRNVWVAWGLLDAFSIIWYSFNSLYVGRVPYFSDMVSTVELLQALGVVGSFFAALSWALQLSIVASCLLFLMQRKQAKWLAYMQVPLRLVFLLPSVSLLMVGAKLMPGYNATIMLMLIGCSEVLKVVSLWKYQSAAVRS